MLVEADLPDDPALLRAMLVAARGEIAQQQGLIADLEGAGTDARAEIERLTAIIAAFQRHRFGARSEQLDPDQLALAFEELDAAVGRCAPGWTRPATSPGRLGHVTATAGIFRAISSGSSRSST